MANGNRSSQKSRDTRERDRLERPETQSYEKQQLSILADRWRLHSVARDALMDGRLNLAALQQQVGDVGEPGARVDVLGGDERLAALNESSAATPRLSGASGVRGSAIQLKSAKQTAREQSPDWVRRVAATGVGGTASAYPFLAQIQRAFGAFDISNIQAHLSPSAAGAASAINARAYATGNNVVFAATPDLHTAAHEAAHVVQQRAGVSLDGGVGQSGDWYERHADSVADLVVQGKSAEGLLTTFAGPAYAQGSAAARGSVQLDDMPEVSGTKIQEWGIAYQPDGVNLRDKALAGSQSNVLRRIQFNERVFVDSEEKEFYFVTTSRGEFGYVAKSHIKTNLPEPDAKIYYIQSGETALDISRKHYGHAAKWGADHRFFVNGLVFVNKGRGDRGIYKAGGDDDWENTQTRAGFMIWVPSLEFMKSLKGQVGSGSITYSAWQGVKSAVSGAAEFLLGFAAYQAGVLHGALEAVWDIFVGIKDLAVLAWELMKYVYELITNEKKSLVDDIAGIDLMGAVEGWIDDFKQKWNNPNSLKKWHFRGWVVGYIMAEVVMAFFTAGALTGVKVAGKASKAAKVVSTLPRVARVRQVAKSSKTGRRVIKGMQEVVEKKPTSRTPDVDVPGKPKKVDGPEPGARVARDWKPADVRKVMNHSSSRASEHIPATASDASALAKRRGPGHVPGRPNKYKKTTTVYSSPRFGHDDLRAALNKYKDELEAAAPGGRVPPGQQDYIVYDTPEPRFGLEGRWEKLENGSFKYTEEKVQFNKIHLCFEKDATGTVYTPHFTPIEATARPDRIL